MHPADLDSLVAAARLGHVIGVRPSRVDADGSEDPWMLPPSGKRPEKIISGPFPLSVRLTAANLVYVATEGLPPALLSRLWRLAAFQNPAFYHAQALRLSTFGKPRVISCAGEFERHLGLPRGCLDDARELLAAYGVDVEVADERRNDLICTDRLKALEEGRTPLLLTERTAHLDELAQRLEGQVRHLVVPRGGMGARKRRVVAEQLEAIPDGEPWALLSTGRYAGEGFDQAQLDTLLLALPVSWRGRTVQQYAGRLNRLHSDKRDVRIYDYLDADVPVLARMYGRRLKGYRALGYMIQSTDDYRPRSDVSPAQLNGMRQLEVEWERQ